jgi:glyoxylase-like metal-dependent hydrolase (beta-lactamase superfamily II)
VRNVALYLLNIDDHYVLIDSGLNRPSWEDVLVSCLKQIQIAVEDIEYCFITHVHLDHIGLIKKLKLLNPNMQICMNDITHELLKWQTTQHNKEELEQIADQYARQLVSYGIEEKKGKSISQFFTMWAKFLIYQRPDKLLQDGDDIKFSSTNLKAIWTPGHSLGHTCYFDTKTRFLFSGDHILSRITPHIGVYLLLPVIVEKYPNYDFSNILNLYLQSLNVIEHLNPKIIFPAHQEIIYNPKNRIQAIKAHHAQRLKTISNLIKNDPMTPFTISQVHFGENLDTMNQFMALSEVLSHLKYLKHQGIVKEQEKDGKILYYC